jgi:hypothetical protein
MNFQKLAVQTFFQHERRAFRYEFAILNEADIGAPLRFFHIMSG